MLNKNSSLENTENYIDEKYSKAAMSHLRQQRSLKLYSEMKIQCPV